jgi:hypothetical protein
MGQTLGTVAEVGLARQNVSSFSERKERCEAANGKLGFFIIKPDCKDASGNIIPEEEQMRAFIAKKDKEKMQQQEMQRGGSKNRKKSRSNKKSRLTRRKTIGKN